MQLQRPKPAVPAAAARKQEASSSGPQAGADEQNQNSQLHSSIAPKHNTAARKHQLGLSPAAYAPYAQPTCLAHELHELRKLPHCRCLLLPQAVGAVVGMQRQVAPQLQAPQLVQRR